MLEDAAIGIDLGTDVLQFLYGRRFSQEQPVFQFFRHFDELIDGTLPWNGIIRSEISTEVLVSIVSREKSHFVGMDMQMHRFLQKLADKRLSFEEESLGLVHVVHVIHVAAVVLEFQHPFHKLVVEVQDDIREKLRGDITDDDAKPFRAVS